MLVNAPLDLKQPTDTREQPSSQEIDGRNEAKNDLRAVDFNRQQCKTCQDSRPSISLLLNSRRFYAWSDNFRKS
jgi:hypothetical protein